MPNFRSVYDYHYHPLKNDKANQFGEGYYMNVNDLIFTKGNKQKRIWLTILSVLLIMALVLICAYLLFGSSDTVQTAALTLSREDILRGKFVAERFNGTWISDTELLYRADGIVKYNVETGEKTVIIPQSNKLLDLAFEYEISPDRKFILLAHNYQKLYRHSYVAQYTIVNVETKQESRVVAGSEVLLQFATWGPTGNSVVYAAVNNIYFRPTATSPVYSQITRDGLLGHIYNGIPDWVYEEEVLNSNRAVWFAPNGEYFAYARFNDTLVPFVAFPIYGPAGSLEFQYPKTIQIRYPKSGAPNPEVSLHVVNALNSSSSYLQMTPPAYLGNEPILAAVTWVNDSKLCAIWMNRVQNNANIIIYDLKDTENIISVKEIREDSGWVELFTAPTFSKDGSKFIALLSQDQGNGKGAFKHITLLNVEADSKEVALTHGDYDVQEILAWDEKNELIYFAAGMEDPATKHIYSVSTQSKDIKCLTCTNEDKSDSNCTYNEGFFSDNQSYFVRECLGPGVPKVEIFAANGKKIFKWNDNQELQETLASLAMPKIERLVFPVEGGFKAPVKIKYPPNMDTSGKTKYPMLITVYGGPGTNQVTDTFLIDWEAYLTANRSIISARIDGRGTGLMGDKKMFSLYHHLGSVEVVDQISVTKQLLDKFKFIDKNRTAIWGWSYGGYMTGMILANDTENVFKCGISVAPVSDWALYDSIYTERFMQLPSENYANYQKTSLLPKWRNFKNKMYYLIHGTLDDNVHYQQSMLWSRVLEDHDILFRQQTYPDQAHELGSVRPHLYHSLENFLNDCFKD